MLALPPVATLIAFEAAARTGSFLAAADELHLTASAVSHRLRQLEDYLGLPLFLREHRRIRLTPEGRRYLGVVQDALIRIAEASDSLRGVRQVVIRISVAPALGGTWLVRHLAAYQAARPEVEFHLATATQLGPLLTGQADLGIRYGEEEWPGLLAWKLFDETITPVLSPALAERLSLTTPADLENAPLLRHPLLSWRQWFAAAGLKLPEPERGTRYEDALLMLEAAAAGQGVALMAATLAQPYLEDGRLVSPFPIPCPDRSFYVVAPPVVQERPAFMDFIRWLLKEGRSAADR